MATNKVAIVTGAGTGVGKSAALALLKDGYHVALVGRRKELLEKTAADSGAADRTLVVATDLARPEGVPPVFAATVKYGLKKAASFEIRFDGIRFPGKGVRVAPTVVAGS